MASNFVPPSISHAELARLEDLCTEFEALSADLDAVYAQARLLMEQHKAMAGRIGAVEITGGGPRTFGQQNLPHAASDAILDAALSPLQHLASLGPRPENPRSIAEIQRAANEMTLASLRRIVGVS